MDVEKARTQSWEGESGGGGQRARSHDGEAHVGLVDEGFSECTEIATATG
jgi:hypothetical protein